MEEAKKTIQRTKSARQVSEKSSSDKEKPVLTPGKFTSYNPLYIMLNAYVMIRENEIEKNTVERLNSIKLIATKIYDVEHFRETREYNIRRDKKKELRKSGSTEKLPPLYFGQLLNESHPGHPPKQETCLLCI